MATETPNIKSIRADRDRRLVIGWKGGADTIVDVSRHLAEFAIFTPLRADDERFATVAVGEWGWCARWSDEMEISSDTLWRLALEQGGA